MSTVRPATTAAVALHPVVVPFVATRAIVHKLHPDAAAPRFGGALGVIADLGRIVLMAWLIPFAILAIASPVVLIAWAALALINKL